MIKMKLKTMSRDERSLLLFLETRAVDYSGRVNIQHMNPDDLNMAKKWNDSGFIEYGRIVFKHINKDGNNWVILSDEAWRLAHEARKDRAKRMLIKRNWVSTRDSTEVHGDPHFSGLNRGGIEVE